MEKLEQLKIVRERSQVSEKECAQALGVSVSTYLDYENNPRRLRVDQAIILAVTLGKDPAEIDWFNPYRKEMNF